MAAPFYAQEALPSAAVYGDVGHYKSMSIELDEILTFSQSEQRICPQPQLWSQLWELLPNKSRVESGWEPSPPLILGAWWHTSDSEKQSRFLSHIHWAAEHDALPKIAAFIKSLTPEQWHYEGQ